MAAYGTKGAIDKAESIIETEVELEHLGRPAKLLGMKLTSETDKAGNNNTYRMINTGAFNLKHREKQPPNQPIRVSTAKCKKGELTGSTKLNHTIEVFYISIE